MCLLYIIRFVYQYRYIRYVKHVHKPSSNAYKIGNVFFTQRYIITMTRVQDNKLAVVNVEVCKHACAL